MDGSADLVPTTSVRPNHPPASARFVVSVRADASRFRDDRPTAP